MELDVKLVESIHELTHTFSSKVNKNLDKQAMPGCMFPILGYLYEVGRDKTQKLGDVGHVTSGTVTHTVTKLLQEGFVEKIQDEGDKRVFWVEITPKGRLAYENVRNHHYAYLEELFKGMDVQQKNSLIDQLLEFNKILETM